MTDMICSRCGSVLSPQTKQEEAFHVGRDGRFEMEISARVVDGRLCELCMFECIEKMAARQRERRANATPASRPLLPKSGSTRMRPRGEEPDDEK